MCSRVAVGEADDAAPRFRSGFAQTWIPEGLEYESIRTRWCIDKEVFEQSLCCHAFLLCSLFLELPKLLFEPRYHPEASVNLNFAVIKIGNGGGIGWDKRTWFQVFFSTNVNGCCCATRDMGHRGIGATRAQYFTGFVCGTCDYLGSY